MSENLTPDQRRLRDEVDQIAGYHGSDCRDVLIALPGTAEDKAAVAEQLGGAGAGAEFRELPADATTAVDAERAYDRAPSDELIRGWIEAGTISAEKAAEVWPTSDLARGCAKFAADHRADEQHDQAADTDEL